MACGADPQGAACVQAVTNALKAAEFYSDPTKSLLAPKIGGYSVVERYLRNGGMDGHAQEAYAKAVYGHREDVIELLEEFLPSTQHTQSQLATANMLMAGIPMVAILAGEGMAICIASLACRTGLAILEVSDCAINPDPTCVTPGPSLPKPDKNTGSAGQNNGTQTANNTGGNGNVGEASKGGVKTTDDLLDGLDPLPSTGGRTTQYQKSGGFDQANADFDALNLNNIREINMPNGGTGRVGELTDGTKVVVRSGSSQNRPGFTSQSTLEIQNPNGATKIRY